VKVRALSELGLDRKTQGRRMNVCIVSSEFLGPVKNGGIGTATSGLAKQLVADGHKVTLLYTYVGYGRPVSGDRPWQHWVDQLAAESIDLRRIPHDGDYRAWREASWLVKEFLGQSDFDLVYFNDHFGSGYYSMLAKRAGLSPFREQLHCVITHGSMEWVFELNDYYAVRMTDVEWMGLERRSVELADIVIAPSTYLLREYERYGWKLPAQTFHQPYPIFRNPTKIDPRKRRLIDELVFFGRLEVRKGLWLFAEALDRIAERFPEIEVTFLGRVTEFSGISSALQIVNRSSTWPFRVRLLTDFNQEQATSYLRKPGKLAVMPSVADNSPCVVYECMEDGIPFVCTQGSGADELVDPSCWDDVFVSPDVDSLAKKLISVLEKGARLGVPRFDPVKNLETWSAWHRFVSENRSDLIRSGMQEGGEEQAGVAQRAEKTALIAIVDNGECELSLLIENLSSHMKRFGSRAAYLLLSARGEEIHHLLSDVFSGLAEAQVTQFGIVGRAAVAEAFELIKASEFVFFADAEAEILTSFFVTAMGILRRQDPSVVTCAVAERETLDEAGEIRELPTGGIPGLAALGAPIGGAVWAVPAAALKDTLSSLSLYSPHTDEFESAATLGQKVMQKCRKEGVAVQFLPVVGAVETRSTPRRATGASPSDMRRSAETLDIVPSIYAGGASWFAVSGLGANVAGKEQASVPGVRFLPAEHPLVEYLDRRESKSGENANLPALAATLGRLDLSLQMQAGSGALPGDIVRMTDLATRANQMRPKWDLIDLFNPEEVIPFGLGPLPEGEKKREKLGRPAARKDDSSAAGARTSSSQEKRVGHRSDEISVPRLGRIYVDARRLQISRSRIRSVSSLREGGAGKVFIVDVPVCGHSSFVGEFRSGANADPMFLQVRIIDQKIGEEMALASVRLTAGKRTAVSMPLFGIYGPVCIVLELSGAERGELAIESLRIE
jgi:glycosyltransferase involved in cell wall biosynthesis